MNEIDVIETLSAYGVPQDEEKFREALEYAIEAVKERMWISVKDRLPELGQNVLVTYTDGDVETNERMALKGIVVWKYGSNVVAWMPLPSPYKGE